MAKIKKSACHWIIVGDKAIPKGPQTVKMGVCYPNERNDEAKTLRTVGSSHVALRPLELEIRV